MPDLKCWQKYDALASRFVENFIHIADCSSDEIKNAGPVRLIK